MVKVLHNRWNSFLLSGVAIKDGKEIQVHGTYAFAPQLTLYDDTNKEWINNWEFVF